MPLYNPDLADHGLLRPVPKSQTPSSLVGETTFTFIPVGKTQTPGINWGNIDEVFRVEGLEPIVAGGPALGL